MAAGDRGVHGGVLLRAYRTADQAAVVALWQACGLVRP